MKWALLGALLFAACSKHERQCFTVAVDDNSEQTNALFEARDCQGGGVTWAGLLTQFARQRGSTRFTIDEEGDAAQFCTDAKDLHDAARAEVARLNADLKALRAALDSADALEVECGEQQ